MRRNFTVKNVDMTILKMVIVEMKKWRLIRVDKKGNLIITYEDWTEEVKVGAGVNLMEYLRRLK